MTTEQKIVSNWNKFIENIETYISGDRKTKLLKFYNDHEERFCLATCSSKKDYHNCFPGGYIDHVNRVLQIAFRMKKVWEVEGGNINFTDEELAFVAINHDLGKFGDEEHDLYIPQTSEWHRKNRGEEYMHNPDVPMMHPSDRSLFILQQQGIPMTYNEFTGIRLHDGLYEESNKYYYISYSGDRRLKTNLPYIISQADLAAARIEFDLTHGSKKVLNKPTSPSSQMIKEGHDPAPKKTKVSKSILAKFLKQ